MTNPSCFSQMNIVKVLKSYTATRYGIPEVKEVKRFQEFVSNLPIFVLIAALYYIQVGFFFLGLIIIIVVTFKLTLTFMPGYC